MFAIIIIFDLLNIDSNIPQGGFACISLSLKKVDLSNHITCTVHSIKRTALMYALFLPLNRKARLCSGLKDVGSSSGKITGEICVVPYNSQSR